MKTRFVALAVCSLMLAAAPLSAAEDRAFVATADGTALKLTVTPPGGEAQGLTIGASSALVQSSASEACEATACATSATAVEPFGATASVAAKNSNQADTAEGFTAPAELEPILSGALGVASVSASPAPSPKAAGEATAGHLEVNVLNTALTPIKDDLDGAVDQIVEGLQPILDPAKEGDPTGLTTEVENLIDALVPALADNPLAMIEVGTSTAAASDAAKKGLTSATATAAGADIKLAPVDVIAPNGLFHIQAGDATATVESDGTKATKSSKGSILKLFILDLSTPKVGDYQEVDVATDQPEQCVGESPLVLCIIAGGTAEDGEGAEGAATAAAVRIRAFADADDPANGNPLPGLTLALAEATAGVNVQLDDIDEPVTPPADDPDNPDQPELPSTGGGFGLLGVAVLGTGAYAVTRIRRR